MTIDFSTTTLYSQSKQLDLAHVRFFPSRVTKTQPSQNNAIGAKCGPLLGAVFGGFLQGVDEGLSDLLGSHPNLCILGALTL